MAYGACASDGRSVGAWTERAPNLRGTERVKAYPGKLLVYENNNILRFTITTGVKVVVSHTHEFTQNLKPVTASSTVT